jgi:hypothetical protein
MEFVWLSVSGKEDILVLEENGKYRFIYQCLLHKIEPFNLLIPSVRAFKECIAKITYPTETPDSLANHIRPILNSTALELEPIPWSYLPFIGDGFSKIDFDFAERDRLGEPNAKQLRYKKTQLYYVTGESGFQDQLQKFNKNYPKAIWGFISRPSVSPTPVEELEDPSGDPAPAPPGYGP